MQITTTVALAAAISLAPAIGAPLNVTLANPISHVSVSAGGLMLETTDDGLKASSCKSGDFTFTLHLKSGTPVTVRL